MFIEREGVYTYVYYVYIYIGVSTKGTPKSEWFIMDNPSKKGLFLAISMDCKPLYKVILELFSNKAISNILIFPI